MADMMKMKKAVRTVPGHSADSLKKRIKRRHYYIESAGAFFLFTLHFLICMR